VIANSTKDHEKVAQIVPLLRGRAPAGEPRAFVCEGYTCQTPAATPVQLLDQLTSSRG
jgi:uncharacterized protein YyaL (SSP411 family)